MPTSLAAFLRDLELDRPEIVTLDDLDRRRRQLDIPIPAVEIARRLRRLGWLLPLRVRGAWEFAPADRGAAVPADDPFIEVRALAVVRPEIFVGVGFESAAFLRGLALQRPDREVLVFDDGTAIVRALDAFRRVTLTMPRQAFGEWRGLQVHTADGLISAISIRPDSFHDWSGLSVWLPTIATQVDTVTQSRLLAGRNASAWSRAAYLLGRGGNDAVADRLLAGRPPGSGPFYLGPRTNRGRYDAATQVVDTVGLWPARGRAAHVRIADVKMGTLQTRPALAGTDLLATPVAKALVDLGGAVYVAPIDPALADTAAFCEAYEVGLDASANCVIVAGKRGDKVAYAACLVLATTRADVNGLVRKMIDARKASFASMDIAVELTGMEYGGITPIGLPADWRILIDSRVDATPWVIVGSGIRGSKILIEGALLKSLPNAEVVPDLAA